MQGQAMIAGDVVNTASRLQSAAPVGAVLVGEETYAATRGVIEYRPAQPLTLKGKQEPVRAWVALHPTAAVGERHVTAVPLIGRERELGMLTGAWTRVADEGRTQFITVFGPSGIGKTRLSLELSQLVAAQGGRVVRGRSTPYGAEHAVQRVRPAGQADRPDLRQRRPRGGSREAHRRRRRPRGAGRRRGAHAEPRDPARAPGRGPSPTARRCSSPPACSSRRSQCTGRRFSSTRTSTGPTTACSTCSRPSPPGCARCRSCSSRSPGRSS